MAAVGHEKDNAAPSDIVSGGFDVEVVTFVDSKGQGANQPCREVQIWPEAGKTVSVSGTLAGAATGGVLPAAHPIVIPISNTNKLFFAGVTGEKVYILWRT